jgi:small basic protein
LFEAFTFFLIFLNSSIPKSLPPYICPILVVAVAAALESIFNLVKISSGTRSPFFKKREASESFKSVLIFSTVLFFILDAASLAYC